MNATIALIERQKQILRDAQREARERGLRVEPRPLDYAPQRRMVAHDTRIRTIDDFANVDNAQRYKKYSWMA